MSKIVGLSCVCGTVKGTLEVVEGSFFHVHCLCCDCQRYASYLKNEDKILDDYGASELFQTYPAYLKISEGHDSIACIRLSEKGLYRWYTSCCNMPLANTMTSAKVPFVGVSTKFMKFENEQEKLEVLGPVTLKAFAKYAKGEKPLDAHPRFPLSFIPKIIRFMIKGKLSKKYTPSPLFKGGEPIVKPQVL